MISYGFHIAAYMYLCWLRSIFFHDSFEHLIWYYVSNLALVGKWTVRFIYTITVYCLCFLFCYYFFIVHTDNLIFAKQICHELTFTLFLLNILWYLWLFGKCFWIKRRKYLPMLLETFFEKGGLNQMMFLLQFLEDLLLFSFSLFGGLYWRLLSYPDWFKIFW